MHNDYSLERIRRPAGSDRIAAERRLSEHKRASLARQALQTARQLGSLVRRVEREAPEVHQGLCDVVRELLLLSERLALQRVEDVARRSGPAAHAIAQRTANSSIAAVETRQGELF